MPGGPGHAEPEHRDERDPRSDAELIAALNAGDAGAFESLYLRHREWVARIARRYGPRGSAAAHDAEDLVQEVFMILLRRFPGFRLTSRLTTYLYPIAKNAALARARRREVEHRLNPKAARPETTGFEPPERLGPLQTALDRLPPGQREVLLMRAVDGMTLEEIGHALGIPVGTVKSRLHTAVQALRSDPAARRYFDSLV